MEKFSLFLWRSGGAIRFQVRWGGHTFQCNGFIERVGAVRNNLHLDDHYSTDPGTIDGARIDFLQAVLAIDGLPGDGTIPDDPSNVLRNTINWRWFQFAFNTDNGQPFYGGDLDFVVSRVARSRNPPPLSFWVFGLVGLAWLSLRRWRQSGGPKGK